MEVDQELLRIAERLVSDYAGQVPATTVIRVLHDCAEALPERSHDEIERATRAQLDSQAVGRP
jgi:hypothetical protein